MNQYFHIKDLYKNRRPLINVVLDGYGIGKNNHTDAVFLAKTPFMDHLKKNYPYTTLVTHGKHVGLPNDNSLGGSEVGHLTLGAGRVIQQGSTQINQMITDGTFFDSPVLQKIYKNAEQSSLHLIGLLSDGNVHSHIDHFEAIIRGAVKQKVKHCYLHILLDGRDVAIQSANIYIERIESLLSNINKDNLGFDYRVASGGGREQITMDRDNNWSKMEKGWNCHVNGKSEQTFSAASEAIEYFRSKQPDLVDQDCPIFNIKNSVGDIPKIKDNDSLICVNFRGDRAIQFSKLIEVKDFKPFPIDKKPDVLFAGLTVYDEDENLPKNRIVNTPTIKNSFGERILNLGYKQFRLAESQKYAHVTFFYNGGYKTPLDKKKEDYILIDSDKIPSFDQRPKMKAFEIAHKAVQLIQSREYDFGLINFANADMVGHSGNIQAAIEAVEIVDKALKKVCDAIQKVNGVAVITADHGNADEMLIFNKEAKREEKSTKHSLNFVPFIIYDPLFNHSYTLKENTENNVLSLSMVASTNYVLMGLDAPNDLNNPLFKM